MKSKWFAAIAFAMLMAIGLCACGQQAASSSAPESSEAASSAASAEAAESSSAVETAGFATLADAFAIEGSETQWTYDEGHFVYAFNDGGQYRVVAVDLPEGMYDSLEAAEFDETKIQELIGNLPVAQEKAYGAPAQEELDALVGKTGAELAAEGYEVANPVVNGNETDCVATVLPFDYLVTFDGAVEDEDTADVASAVKDLTVKSVSVQGLNYQALELE